jgi:hypothetical protein
VIGLDVAICKALIEPFHQVSHNRLSIPYSQVLLVFPSHLFIHRPVLLHADARAVTPDNMLSLCVLSTIVSYDTDILPQSLTT